MIDMQRTLFVFFLALGFWSGSLSAQDVASGSFNYDEALRIATQMAWDGQYDQSRLLCNRILRDKPEYVDARLLLGNTYSWNKQYREARDIYYTIFDYENANIDALKRAGVTDLISLSAVGSFREELPPGTFVIVDQFIDRTFAREKSFFGAGMVAHVSMAHPVNPRLGDWCARACESGNIPMQRGGTYLVMEGPQFSTLAESQLYRQWNCDVIGMTNMPEAKLAREAEMAYAMVALPSDYDCWRPAPATLDKHELLREIIGNLQAATQNAVALIKAAIERFDAIAEIESPAHSAMEMGIWTRPDSIDPAEKQRLDLLVGKYLK